jgi:hypothetical protein
MISLIWVTYYNIIELEINSLLITIASSFFKMSDRVVVLFTSTPKTLVEVAQNRLYNVIAAKKLVADKFDGCLTENKEIRDKLFGISNKRGDYPQIFLKRGDDYIFVGLWEQVMGVLKISIHPLYTFLP